MQLRVHQDSGQQPFVDPGPSQPPRQKKRRKALAAPTTRPLAVLDVDREIQQVSVSDSDTQAGANIGSTSRAGDLADSMATVRPHATDTAPHSEGPVPAPESTSSVTHAAAGDDLQNADQAVMPTHAATGDDLQNADQAVMPSSISASSSGGFMKVPDEAPVMDPVSVQSTTHEVADAIPEGSVLVPELVQSAAADSTLPAESALHAIVPSQVRQGEPAIERVKRTQPQTRSERLEPLAEPRRSSTIFDPTTIFAGPFSIIMRHHPASQLPIG